MSDKDLSKRLTTIALIEFEKIAEKEGFTIEEHFKAFAQGFTRGLVSAINYEIEIKKEENK